MTIIPNMNLEETVKHTLEYCLNNGFNEMGLNQIGGDDKKLFRLRTFYDFADQFFFRPTAFTIDDLYNEFRNQNQAEYVLDDLCNLGYIKQRRSGSIVTYYEEELKKTLDSLGAKHTPKDIQKLKQRLKIIDIKYEN